DRLLPRARLAAIHSLPGTQDTRFARHAHRIHALDLNAEELLDRLLDLILIRLERDLEGVARDDPVGIPPLPCLKLLQGDTLLGNDAVSNDFCNLHRLVLLGPLAAPPPALGRARLARLARLRLFGGLGGRGRLLRGGCPRRWRLRGWSGGPGAGRLGRLA